MKKLLLASVLAVASTTAANAWTSRSGHWHEGPLGAVYAPVAPAYVYGPPPPAIYGYGGPVIVERPTDTQIAITAGAALLGAVLSGGR
jgi:hypothetical protein